jgi:hypothetical protein
MGWTASQERGQGTLEYVLVLCVIGLVALALTLSGVAGRATATAQTAVCRLFESGECTATATEAAPGQRLGYAQSPEDLQRELALIEGEQRRAPFVQATGGRVAQLAAEAQAARERGDYDTAERIGQYLDFLAGLSHSGPRGALVGQLTFPDDATFDQMVASGTIYGDDGSATRYLRVPPAPGEGILVYDLFIRQSNSGPLEGDDRGFADPLRGGLSPDDSRVIVIVDRESGRVMIRVSGSCTVSAFGNEFCSEARPISLSDQFLVDDPEHDATGEGINYDTPNRFHIEADENGVTVQYDALNSVTPLIVSVDGTIELRRRPDGTYEVVPRERDDYPATGVYHYRPDGTYEVIFEEPGGDVACAVPEADLPEVGLPC